MNIDKKYVVWIGLFAVLVIASGVVFYKLVVGDDSTHILSVIFGWQWIYLAVASIVALVVAAIRKSRSLAMAGVIVFVSLAVVLVPARIVEATRFYITGEGGPSGPHFACLVWDNAAINLRNGAYRDAIGLCTLMSIPSYNKFLIDQRRNADQLEASPTYYAMFVLNEMVVVGGLWLGCKCLTRKEEAPPPRQTIA